MKDLTEEQLTGSNYTGFFSFLLLFSIILVGLGYLVLKVPQNLQEHILTIIQG